MPLLRHTLHPLTLGFTSGEEAVIPAGGKAMVNTHISLAVPIGTYGRVAPRSGLGKSRNSLIDLAMESDKTS